MAPPPSAPKTRLLLLVVLATSSVYYVTNQTSDMLIVVSAQQQEQQQKQKQGLLSSSSFPPAPITFDLSLAQVRQPPLQAPAGDNNNVTGSSDSSGSNGDNADDTSIATLSEGVAAITPSADANLRGTVEASTTTEEESLQQLPDAAARDLQFSSAQAILPFDPLAWFFGSMTGGPGAYGLGQTTIGSGGLFNPVWSNFGSTFMGAGPGYGCRGTVGCRRRGVNVGFGPARGSIYSQNRGFDDK